MSSAMRSFLALALSLSLGVLVSCAGTGQVVKTWTGTFAGCEKADLGQLVQSGDLQTALLDDVASLIEGNAATLEADLQKLAEGVGLEAVTCAVLASESVMTPKTGAIAPRARPQGLVRAKTWIATQPKAKGTK